MGYRAVVTRDNGMTPVLSVIQIMHRFFLKSRLFSERYNNILRGVPDYFREVYQGELHGVYVPVPDSSSSSSFCFFVCRLPSFSFRFRPFPATEGPDSDPRDFLSRENKWFLLFLIENDHNVPFLAGHGSWFLFLYSFCQ